MIRSAWRIWKRFRWKNLVRVWAVFMAIALVLLAQTLGIHYGATKFTLKYMARNGPERHHGAARHEPDARG